MFASGFMAHSPRPMHNSLSVIFTIPTGALTHSNTELGSAIFVGSEVDHSGVVLSGRDNVELAQRYLWQCHFLVPLFCVICVREDADEREIVPIPSLHLLPLNFFQAEYYTIFEHEPFSVSSFQIPV